MEKIKKDYYYYVDLVNKKKKKDGITFEKFYDFYSNAILFAEKRNLNPNLALIDENFYDMYYESFFIYNEESEVKKGFLAKIVDKTTGFFDKLKSLSTIITSFFIFIKLEITTIASATVRYIYEAIVDDVKKINDIFKSLNKMKSDLFQKIKDGIILIIGEKNIESINSKLKDKNFLIEAKNFLNSGPIRVSLALMLCGLIIYVWTNSAFSGNIFFDFNIEAYINILTANDIFSIIQLELIIEVIAWFILNKLISIPIEWLGTGNNVYLVIGLIVVSLLFRYIENNSIEIGDINVKQKICLFLRSKGNPPIANDITQIITGFAQNIGVFGPQKDVKKIFCNYKKIEKEKAQKNIQKEI